MLSIPHMLVVFVIVLVVFGPQKLPELAREPGKNAGGVPQGFHGFQERV